MRFAQAGSQLGDECVHSVLVVAAALSEQAVQSLVHVGVVAWMPPIVHKTSTSEIQLLSASKSWHEHEVRAAIDVKGRTRAHRECIACWRE